VTQLREGDIMFTTISGGAGLVVAGGQLLLAAGERGPVWRAGVRKWWRRRHTGVVVRKREGLELCVVQAMPGGAEIAPLRFDSDTVYLRPPYDNLTGFDQLPQNMKVAEAAKRYVGTPYDFATYGAIPLWRRGIRTEGLEHIISDTDTMMCSRLVDASLQDAHFHLFDDGRIPGDVTPSEAYRRLVQLGSQLIE